MFQIKDKYNLALQTPEAMKLFGSAKKINRQNNKGKNKPSLEVVEVVLIQWNLVDNQYQQKSWEFILLRLINLMLIFPMLNQAT